MTTREQYLNDWKTDGYALVEDFLAPTELATAQRELTTMFPSWDEYAAAPDRFRNDPLGGHMRELPFVGRGLNAIALHHGLIGLAEELLGTDRITLLQAIVWAKYGGVDDFDQAIHVDYPSYTILYPVTRGRSEQVTFIVYYVDVDETLGPTCVVSRQHTRDQSLVPYLRPRHTYPELYRHERPMTARAGSILAYDIATFHRGSRIASPVGVRFTHHIVYSAATATRAGAHLWANPGLSAEMQALIEQATPRQRQVLGFPGPGDPYWDEQTLAGIAARYPKADLKPYREAANLSPAAENVDRRAAIPAADRPATRRTQPARKTNVAPAPGSVMLNLGSDAVPLDGFLNVDIVAAASDNTADLQERWPWPDNSVDYVHAPHVIEHLPDPVFTVNELWRILKAGGVANIVVATTDGPALWTRPTHVSFWNRTSFVFCESGSYWRNTLGASYGIRAKFRTVACTTTRTPQGPELSIVLQAVKP